MSLTQMLLQRNTGVNTQNEDSEDEEDDENHKEISNEGENEGTFLFVVDIKFLRQASMWKNSSVKFVSVS